MKFPNVKLGLPGPSQYREHVRPVRDWFIITAISGVVFFGSLAWNIWLFYRVVHGESLATVTATSSTPIDTASLDALGGFFDKRATETLRYENEYQFVDPGK